MRIVKMRLYSHGIKRDIRDTQKEYYYLCPINDVAEGDVLLVQAKHYFTVGKVEYVYDLEETRKMIRKYKPTSLVIARVDVPDNDFYKRCEQCRGLKHKYLNMYEHMRIEKEKRKEERKKRKLEAKAKRQQEAQNQSQTEKQPQAEQSAI